MSDTKRLPKPLTFDGLVQWLVSLVLGDKEHKHKWKVTRLQSKTKVYTTRMCDCGVEQLKHDGPMGDHDWHDLDISKLQPWVAEDFKTAKVS